ncbi:MAG: DUF6880 family protein [Deltaproteobacteria bacterium]
MPSERMRYLAFIPTTPEPPRMTRDELRARLDAMSQERLVGLVMDLTDAEHDLLVRVRRMVLAQTDATSGVVHLRAAIDRTLRVRTVEWDEVSGFVNELDVVVGEIQALARTDPKAGLDVALYFLEALPRVFEAVHGENELGMFAEDFARVLLSLAAKAKMPFEAIAETVLRAVAADGYGYFNELPEVVRGACTTPEMERAVMKVAEVVVAGEPDRGGRWAVEGLVEAMRLVAR